MQNHHPKSFIQSFRSLVLVATLLLASKCLGAVHYIPQGGIANHANPSTPNSIAWFFVQFAGAPGDIYVLNDPNNDYHINGTLYIPANQTLRGTNGVRIVADAGLDDQPMVVLDHWSSVEQCEVDGDHKARHCVTASGKTGPAIRDCLLERTKNNYTVATGRPHVVFFTNCHQVNILDSLIQFAGYPKATAQQYVYFWGSGIFLDACGTQVNINRNTIAGVLHAGIALNGPYNRNISINDNNISNTGMNATYPNYATAQGYADGITGYHNLAGENVDLNWLISNNTIINSHNHGIHVSGHGITVQYNTISGTYAYNIYLGDYKDPIECTSGLIIGNNCTCPSSGNRSFKRDHYTSVTISGNTGCTTVASGQVCQ